jgi:hypothetical protein
MPKSQTQMCNCLKFLATCIFAAWPSLVLCQQPGAALQPTPTPTPVPAEAEAETVAGTPSSGIILLSILPKALPIVCMIGTNNVVMEGTAEELIGPGSTTGLIPWSPPNDQLVARAKGYAPGSLKPFLKAGETPVVLLTESPSGTLAFKVLPNTTERGGDGFYEAINLTTNPNLQVAIDGKTVSLPRGKRVRVSTAKQMSYSIPGGNADTLGTDNPPHRVLIFHQDTQGKTVCSAMPDMLLQ